MQGERQFAKDNKSLGQFRLDGIPPAQRGVPQIEVTFDIDANGIVNVSAKDLGTGREQHITITAGSNMSDSDIEKAIKEAAEYEAQDKKRKEGVEVRNEADSIVFQTEKALNEVGDKIDANEKSAVEADLAHLKELLEKLKAYRFPLLILLVGVALMLLPSASSHDPAPENSLGEALSLTQGVGEAYVLVSERGVVVVCDGAQDAAT